MNRLFNDEDDPVWGHDGSIMVHVYHTRYVLLLLRTDFERRKKKRIPVFVIVQL